MLVDKQSEQMSDLLFTVHQHGGDDVTWKPPQVVWKMCFKHQLNLPCVILSVILGTTYLVNSTFSKNYARTYTQASRIESSVRPNRGSPRKQLSTSHTASSEKRRLFSKTKVFIKIPVLFLPRRWLSLAVSPDGAWDLLVAPGDQRLPMAKSKKTD